MIKIRNVKNVLLFTTISMGIFGLRNTIQAMELDSLSSSSSPEEVMGADYWRARLAKKHATDTTSDQITKKADQDTPNRASQPIPCKTLHECPEVCISRPAIKPIHAIAQAVQPTPAQTKRTKKGYVSSPLAKPGNVTKENTCSNTPKYVYPTHENGGTDSADFFFPGEEEIFQEELRQKAAQATLVHVTSLNPSTQSSTKTSEPYPATESSIGSLSLAESYLDPEAFHAFPRHHGYEPQKENQPATYKIDEKEKQEYVATSHFPPDYFFPGDLQK